MSNLGEGSEMNFETIKNKAINALRLSIELIQAHPVAAILYFVGSALLTITTQQVASGADGLTGAVDFSGMLIPLAGIVITAVSYFFWAQPMPFREFASRAFKMTAFLIGVILTISVVSILFALAFGAVFPEAGNSAAGSALGALLALALLAFTAIFGAYLSVLAARFVKGASFGFSVPRSAFWVAFFGAVITTAAGLALNTVTGFFANLRLMSMFGDLVSAAVATLYFAFVIVAYLKYHAEEQQHLQQLESLAAQQQAPTQAKLPEAEKDTSSQGKV